MAERRRFARKADPESPWDKEMESRPSDSEDYFVPLQRGEVAPPQVPPPAETKRLAGAFRDYIARRGLVGLLFHRPSEDLQIEPDNPTVDKHGTYKVAAIELVNVKCGDGVVRQALLVKTNPEGYARSGTVGTEALEVSVKSNYVLSGGKVVFSAACGNINAFADGERAIGGTNPEQMLYARFRVRNPYVSRVLLKLRSITQGDMKVGAVLVWIAKGQPTKTAAVTPFSRITADEISDVQQTFNKPFDVYLSVVDESVSACPVPTIDDTYYLCVEPEAGATVTLATRTDGAGEFWPFFEVYTLVGSASGGIGPGGLPATAVRAQSIVKAFGQKPTVPGATPNNLFTLADGVTVANQGLFPAPIAATDAGADTTSLVAASPATIDFWEVVMKPFVLPRGQAKVKIMFTPGGGNSVTVVTVALLKNSAAGTQVVATRTFPGLAFGAVQEFAIPLPIAGDTTYNVGDNFGFRITLTHNVVGTLVVNHARGGDQSHLEVAISA